MKLLWKLDTAYNALDAFAYNVFYDEGERIYIPYSGKIKQRKITLSFRLVDKRTGSVSDSPDRVEILDIPKRYYAGSPEKKEYIFGNKTVRAKQFKNKESHVIECLEDGKTLWELKFWAYLYTDIIEKDGCIIFGTDGMGSRLYSADLQTGKILLDMKTHYTGFYDFSEFSWYNGNLVVYGKGTLAVVDPFSGRVVDEHKIPAKYTCRSFLRVIDGYAYCCVHTDNYKHTLLCFEL